MLVLTGGEAMGQASQTGGGSVPTPLPCSVMQYGKDRKQWKAAKGTQRAWGVCKPHNPSGHGEMDNHQLVLTSRSAPGSSRSSRACPACTA